LRIYAASLAVLANSHHERELPIESEVRDRSMAVLLVLVNWKGVVFDFDLEISMI
jgi:hypothetical protein